jgi:hypothetical protein
MYKAIIKFNNGNGALLCSNCRVIIKTFSGFTKEEMSFYKKNGYLKAAYCDKCLKK